MSSSSEPTGVALLGAGIFAKEAYLPALAAIGSSIALRAIYSRSYKSASDLASTAKSLLKLSTAPDVYSDDSSHNLLSLLARSDIAFVIVALPISTQPKIVLQCLAAGKHVLSEKPVAPNVKSGLDLIAEYERSYKAKGLIWRVAENYETEPGYRAAVQAIKAGEIGDIRFFRLSAVGYVDKDSKWYKTPWRTVPDYQGGFLLDGGVHSVALLRTILQTPIQQVTSYASLSREHLAPQDTITALLSCTTLVNPPNDSKDKLAHGIFELSFAAPAPSRAGVGNATIITGNKGWMQIANAKGSDGKPVVRVTIHKVTHEPVKEGDELKEEEKVIEEQSRSIEAEVAIFLDLVNGGVDEGLGEPRAALVDVAVIQAALTSEGTPVDIQKLLREG